jgi:LuxR family maltose regulon positive regulatory protein
MPGPSPHTLIWSDMQQHYELSNHGHLEHCFRRGDEPAWQSWLDEHTAFAFVGQAGRLSVLKEVRSRGAGYWYAYRTRDRHTHKRYLGPTARVTITRLEAAAKGLTDKLASAPSHPPHEELASSVNAVETRREEPRPNVSYQDEQRVVLLSPKLSRPRPSTPLVERERLLSELDAARAHPLTLVSASAGSGKTTLLSTWATPSLPPLESLERMEGAGRDGAKSVFAWLSLDSLDNDPIRFWASVMAALRTCLPKVGQRAFSMLHSSESPPLSTILMTLLQDLVEVGSDIILILDDYHVISDQAIVDSVLFFIDHLPESMHLVLATRTDPELPLSRFRVRGQMLEIRDRDLRFTRQEAASFLTEGMGLSLSEGEVATLHQRTEGWIAGLQLAALSLRKREDPSSFVKDFTGSHRFVLDYVQQDILARLSVPLQDFVLQTSILTRMNAALCQAVTARPERSASQGMLEVLERANLFIVPLDEQRQWYRYHDLFREALLARLQASQPEVVPLLHLRAARWYEMASEWREAITHALAAPDYSYAASLMEQAAPHFWLSGETRTIHVWVFSLPDAVLCAHLRLALNAALRFIDSVKLGNEMLYVSMAAQVERAFMRMEEILHKTSELSLSEAEVVLIKRRLRLLRALIEVRTIFKRGDQERLRLLSQEIEALPQDEEASWKMIPLSMTLWLTVYLQGEGASLIPRLLAGKQVMSEAGDPPVTIRAMTMLAHAYIQAAQLHLALQECQEALALMEQTGGRTIWSGYLYHALLIISYARNRLEEASDWLKLMLRSAQDWHQMELLILGELCSARLSLARGDLATTYQALQRAEALAEQEGFAYYAPWIRRGSVHCWLAEARLAEASTWAVQIRSSPETAEPLHREDLLTLVRVMLAQKQYIQADETLSYFNRYFDQPENLLIALEWLALSVVVLHHAGRREQAQEVAVRLLQLSEPEGFIRVYLDVGSPMKQALKMLLETPRSDDPGAAAVTIFRPYVSRLLAAFEQEKQRLAKVREASSAPLYNNSLQQTLIEPLSRQEQQVLRLLVAGRTYGEIADAEVVSPNTIKTQISSIYRKLGVSRRAEAIELTHRLHLL